MIDKHLNEMEVDKEGLKAMHKEMSQHGGEALFEFQESNGLHANRGGQFH
jgi:hypothetical protein